MRKVIISICLILFAVVASSQLSVTGTYLKFDKVIGKDTVTVIIFDSITKDSEIKYTNSYKKIDWYKYSDLNTCVYCNLDYLSPDKESNGYALVVDGDTSSIYVINYSQHRPVFTSLEVEYNPKNQCSSINLLLTAKIPALKYQTQSGKSDSLKREFSIKYKTMKFTETWSSIDTTETITLPQINMVDKEISVKSPLCDTYFTIVGDQYATQLQNNDSIKSPIYSAVAVKCFPTFVVEKRDELQEEDRPAISSQPKFSAPMSCEFLSNANEPVANNYSWQIFKNKQLLIPRKEKDHRYTFTEAGEYEVKLIVSNSALCQDSGLLKISISESSLLVPNVFTPNGDGQNEEFRVAYKSINSFEAWVYNRWGRKVFYWNDPQKGWDGNINGKKATPGPYFYVIKATGSDGVKYLKKGDINLLRGVDK